jgi:protoheme IX farnesyltransferase
MSVSALTYETAPAARTTRLAVAADWIELTKPKILALELVVVAVAAIVASSWGPPDALQLIATLLGTALTAASASLLNQWLERKTDGLMQRTENRPLPQGRVRAAHVFWAGAALIVAGVALLAVFVGPAPAALGLLTWTLYVWIYTPLKRLSHANTLVGAIAGALPALIGWTSTGREIDMIAATLFLVVFLWQFPHFMAIAWLYRRDYAAGGMKMLSVVDPSGRRAGAQAVTAALALAPVSLIPAMLLLEPTYFVGALALGVAQLLCAVRFSHRRDDASARWLLRASLVYLPALLLLLLSVPVS